MSEIRETRRVSRSVIAGKRCDQCGVVERDYEKLAGWHSFMVSFRYSDAVLPFDACGPGCFLATVRQQMARGKIDLIHENDMSGEFVARALKEWP